MGSTSSLTSLLNGLSSSNALTDLLDSTTNSTNSTSSSSSSTTDTADLEGSIGAEILDSVYAPNSNGGLGSGINVQDVVNEMIQADSAPITLLKNEETALGNQYSALQTINSDLSNLQTSVEALTDFNEAFSSLAVSSSDNSVLTATAGSGATVGTHSVTVTNLATASSYYTNEQTSSTLPTGSFDLAVGTNAAVTIPVNSSDNTLAGLASYIKSLNMGVTANVITDANGSRLSLVSNTTGAAGDLTIAASSDSSGLGWTQAANSGQNASLTVDGIPISSSSNTVQGVIPGVTLSLAGAGSAVTLSVSPDTDQATTAINNFVSSYNQLMQDINTQLTTNTSTGSASPLLGDSSLELVQQTVLQDVASSISGNDGYTSLASIGITMNDDGTLTVDSGTLSNALDSNFTAVQNLFQSTSPGGVATTFANDLTNLTDPTQGPLNAESNQIEQQVTDLNNQIQDFQTNLTQTQQQLTDQYSTVNATLEELPMLLDAVNTQLSSLNPSSTSL